MQPDKNNFSELVREFSEIAIALSSEKNHARLLEMILLRAKAMTNADGGTLYTRGEDKCLHFETMITDSLNIHLGGTSGKPIPFPPLELYNDDGEPNFTMVATWAVLHRQSVNIEDAYKQTQFDFLGTKAFDRGTGYHSQSFLTIPMTNHLNQIIGVLQLINARDKETGKVIAFSKFDQQLVESLASQAAVIMTNRSLIDAQKALFDALIQLIAVSVDEKSAYTANHCRRVPVITRLLAQAACQIDKGPLKDFSMTEEEIYELDVAAWLHDCGKITTPVQVMDKATKLEALMDRVHCIDTRFEVLKRDAVIEALYRQGAKASLLDNDEELQQLLQTLDAERDLIRHCNIGGEYIKPEDVASMKRTAQRMWRSPSGEEQPLLTDEELENLMISRGTLSDSDREIINHHVVVTAKLLESLPYPKNLKHVPLIAGCHHEKVNGKGYPKGLTKDEMPIQARMLAIADVFEALTSSDRPYKKPMPLSKTLQILGQMKLDGHIDPDLFDVFIHSKAYLTYAEQYLDKGQIDAIDITTIPGYAPLE
jgi:HD-GYP domain-containing protein (c-di-GMP phosphodiesterase class II)